MSYMWNEFNIKTMRAETIVYRDGVYCPDLSTLENKPIDKKYDLPVHIIYVGEISGENNLSVNITCQDQQVVLSVNVKNKKPAFLNIFIKNTGKNSEIRGTVFLENNSELKYNCVAHHLCENTAILIKNKLLTGKKSVSELSGVAIIDTNCPGCASDVGFVAMADEGAKIIFKPEQRISAEPLSAEHSAAIYRPSEFQIQYLRGAGLSGAEVDLAMKEAFMSE